MQLQAVAVSANIMELSLVHLRMCRECVGTLDACKIRVLAKFQIKEKVATESSGELRYRQTTFTFLRFSCTCVRTRELCAHVSSIFSSVSRFSEKDFKKNSQRLSLVLKIYIQ